jgi:Xaa-Pro dipeptidase
VVQAGDLVALDTDVVGPGGMYSFCLAHGVGLTGEYPYILHPQDIDEFVYDGVIEENMTLFVESYIGSEHGAEGVKLEQQFLIRADGPELLSTFPLEEPWL